MLKASLKQMNKKSKYSYKLPKSRIEVVKENKNKKINTKKLAKRIKLGKRFRKVFLVLGGVFFIAAIIGVVVLLTLLQDVSKKLPTPDKVFPDVPLATEILDRKGLQEGNSSAVLYRLYGESNADPVNLEDIPDVVKASFLAAEDDNFFNHNGYDAQGLVRCMFIILRRAGQCGASTITQQLIKLTTKDNAVSVDRKIREILMAIRVEDNYTKDEIMEMYLRVTSYGSNLVGIKAASDFYFYKDPANPELGGKEPQELSLAQAAILAAIVQNPSILSPTVSLADQETAHEQLTNRLNYIFDQMEAKLDSVNAQLKKNKGDLNAPDTITREMIEQARNEDWKSTLKPPVFTDKKAGHFVDYVTDQLLKRNYKNGEEPFTLTDLQTGGYKIYTTLDYDMQKVAEKYVKDAGDAYKGYGMNNAALMTSQPSTGQILTMVGSKNFYGQDEGDGCAENIENCLFNPQVNILTTPQSPGSTNKVMGYYLAFKSGKLAPGTVLPDIPIKIGSYEPKNWNSSFSGAHQSAREMLRQSKNLPALHVVELDGVDNFVKTAQEWGYSTYNGDYGPSVILGGADVLPVEHVQAFSIFANGGDWVELDPILKIIDKDGNVVYEAKPNRKSLGDQQAVYLMNQTLYKLDTLGNTIAWDDRDIAGKTGTSEDNRDNWIVEWSPDFVTLGWGGNNNNVPMDPNNAYPGLIVIPWVKNYMNEVSSFSYFTSKTAFSRPGFVYQGGGSEDCNDKGECQGIARDWLIQGREPKKGDFTRKKVKVCTDQTDRVAREIDIVMGKVEEREFIYYKNVVENWQGFLDNYIKEKGGVPNGGPTESCNVDRTGGVTSGPFFNFSSINAPSTASINIKGGVYSLEGKITNVTFYLNNNSIPGCNVPAANYGNFDITCDISGFNLDNGTYKFKASATDDKFAGTNYFNPPDGVDVVIGSATTSNFSFVAPTPSGTVGNNSNHIVRGNYSGPAALNNVKLCVVRAGALVDCYNTIGAGNTYSYNWNSGGTDAEYRFYFTATTAGGLGRIQSGNAEVNVQ